jgi:LPS export ABC transporter permease LptF/LPS export ABC transporter permease LptG
VGHPPEERFASRVTLRLSIAMRIFTRYILREVVSYALLGGVVFTFVLFMRDLGKILDLVVRDSASLTDVLRIFAYTLPNTLTFSIPTAVLAGILLGLSRLASDSEITAMRACGIGALSFVRIVSILSVTALAFGLINALYFVPSAARNLLKLEDQLKSSQASFEVQPRVFYEDFKNYVLYVQDVRPTAGAAVWHHVFLADLTQPANPYITTADQALVASSADSQDLRLHLLDGGRHEISPNDPNQSNIYNITTFTATDLPLEVDSHDETHISRMNTPLQALSLGELWQRTHGSGFGGQPPTPAAARAARIEFNIRFSYPFACLVLTLIGVPLGLSSKRGGKSTGFVLTLLLVFVYYLLAELGVGFAKSGKLSPLLGVWGANLIFAAFGSLLLQQLAGGGVLLNLFTALGATLAKMLSSIAPRRIASAIAKLTDPNPDGVPHAASGTSDPSPGGAFDLAQRHPNPTLVQRMRRVFKTSFPLLLDEYVMRAYAANFALSLGTFAVLIVVFAFFELIGDIVRNQTPFVIVGEYLFNLIPKVVSLVTPLCSLLAVLITFGSLNRSSELTAMKATGISLYRVVAPVLVFAAILATALFAFDESYLPSANRRLEQLRAEIKGKPAQTFLNPNRKWISGQTDSAGAPTRIFYYQFFDPDPGHEAFANLTVFEFDPQSFTLLRRIFANSVRWDPSVDRWIFDNGWQRTFSGETIATYQPFTVSTFPEIREQPTYFKKEATPSDEMSYGDLDQYIADLRQSGFDTVKLRVQLERKLSEPAITLVMAILAVPFAVSMGKRGGLAGIATAVGVAIVYWVVAGVFSSMGDINTLPPVLAAWSPDLLFGIAGAYLLLRTPT